jgi:L-ornithine Nalpha-acyltransferase
MVIDHHKDDQLAAYTRLLLSDNLPDGLGFIAEDEFSIPLLDKFTTQSMEIGRTCVHPDYRDGQAIQMLWQGITKFVFDHNILFLFGCASFHETNPDQIANQLTYLHKYHLADEENRARSLDYIPLARLPDDQIERRSALAQMPPLVKAYLQLGGVVGDGCFLDQDFKTLDVLVTVEISKVPQQYSKYFKKLANRLTFESPIMRKQ